MLGYLLHDDSPAGNALIGALARDLAARGLRLAGAVQGETPPDRAGQPCGMELTLLGVNHPPIRISQSLGAGAQGCRLDSDALERAAGLAATALGRADLLIVNKFGKVEAEGRGFRPLIGQALLNGIPVLTAVAPKFLDAFAAFADDMGQGVAAEDALDWCLAVRAAA